MKSESLQWGLWLMDYLTWSFNTLKTPQAFQLQSPFATSNYKRIKPVRFFGIACSLNKYDASIGHVAVPVLKRLLSVVSIGFVREALTIIPICIEIRCCVLYLVLEENYFKFQVAPDLTHCRRVNLYNLTRLWVTSTIKTSSVNQKCCDDFKSHKICLFENNIFLQRVMYVNITQHIHKEVNF